VLELPNLRPPFGIFSANKPFPTMNAPQLEYVKDQVKYEIGLYTARKRFNHLTNMPPFCLLLFLRRYLRSLPCLLALRKNSATHGYMALMALTGRRPAEIFFSAKFSLPKKKLPFPAVIFDGQLKTRHAPGTSFEPIPVLADPKKIIRAPRPTPGSQNLQERRCRQHHHRPSVA
jgi:hypothetical protein